VSVSDLDNWAGPYRSMAAACEKAYYDYGSGHCAVWLVGDKWYVNDGIDPETGQWWQSLPDGAKWYQTSSTIHIEGPVPTPYQSK
jgi:hypothetical protein